jgi:hypothetical protein
MLKVYKEMPSVIYPPGTIVEDEKMIMKMGEMREVVGGHSYKVEVLKWKVMPPEFIQRQMDMKNPWVLITAYSVPKMKVIG